MFRLPCLDHNIETQLAVCPPPLLPNEHDDDCVLTLSSCWEHDDKGFMLSKMQLLEKDTLVSTTKLLQCESWTTLPDLIEQMQDVGCLSVTGCGHKFSGLSLLYIFMTTGFKCLICRYGDNAKVDITVTPPKVLCTKVWEAMCVERKRDMLEKLNHERFVAMQMARQTISVVYVSLPWMLRFVLYKDPHPGVASAPFAQIPIKMSIDRNTALQSRQGQLPDTINLTAGMCQSADFENLVYSIISEKTMPITHTVCTIQPTSCIYMIQVVSKYVYFDCVVVYI